MSDQPAAPHTVSAELTVLVPCPDVQQQASPETDSSTPDSCVPVQLQSPGTDFPNLDGCVPEERESPENVSQDHDSGVLVPLESPKTDSSRVPATFGTSADMEAGGKVPPPPEFHTGFFSLDAWVCHLNQSLHDLEGSTKAQLSLLTDALKQCDLHVKELTEDFAQSEAHLTTLIRKPSTKKTQKKAIRMFDSDLRAVNRRVDDVGKVRAQLQDRLQRLAGGPPPHPPLPPLQTLTEVKGEVKGAVNNRMCTDLILCVTLSLLVFLLVSLLMMAML